MQIHPKKAQTQPEQNHTVKSISYIKPNENPNPKITLPQINPPNTGSQIAPLTMTKHLMKKGVCYAGSIC